MDFKERVRRKNEFDGSIVCGTREFNLLTNRKKHLEYRKQFDNQWVDSKTGIICKKYTEYRNCPLCDSAKSEELFIKSGFPHVKCAGCGLVYVNPILNKNEYVKLSSCEASWEDVLETEHEIKMHGLEASYILDIVDQYLQKKEEISVCDVGCGPGTFLVESKKRGYSVFGIEPNKRCYRFLEEKGIDYLGDFFPSKQNIKRKFDSMFLLSALEHIREPLNVLLEARKLLKPLGIICISVPNINALVTRILHEKSGTFGGHTHIQFFDIETLSLLLQKSGFEVLEYETMITELGVIRNYLGFKDPYFGDQAECLDFLTPELIYKNNIARTLLMIGRVKPSNHVGGLK